jgi:glycosyltransferase involved in cell wall biosynthesis
MAGCVYTVQNSYQNYKLRNRLLLYPMFAAFPRVVLCSNSALRSMPPLLRWLGRGKTVVVQNAVDTRRARRIADAAGAEDRDEGFTVISVGRLIEVKNPAVLIEAFGRSHRPDGRLVFVGDGPLRARLRAQADRRGLNGQVVFTGLVERDDVYKLTARGDVFVSTSRGEGLPVAVLEAMACARPVILSDIPPHREIAGDADFIPLIPPDDGEGFTAELQRFTAMTHRQRTEIGQRCRQLVEERFSLAAMHGTYVSVYADVMRPKVRDDSSGRG